MPDLKFQTDAALPARPTRLQTAPADLRGGVGSFAQLMHGGHSVATRVGAEGVPRRLAEPSDDTAPAVADTHAPRFAAAQDNQLDERDDLVGPVTTPDLSIPTEATGAQGLRAPEPSVVAAGRLPGGALRNEVEVPAEPAVVLPRGENGAPSAQNGSTMGMVVGGRGYDNLPVEQAARGAHPGTPVVAQPMARPDNLLQLQTHTGSGQLDAATGAIHGAEQVRHPISAPGVVATAVVSGGKTPRHATAPELLPRKPALAERAVGQAQDWRAARPPRSPDTASALAVGLPRVGFEKPVAVAIHQGWQAGLGQPIPAEPVPDIPNTMTVPGDGFASAPIASGGAASAPAAVPATPPGPPIQQIAQAFVQATKERFEVQLSPEELGRVRIQMQPSDSGVHVVITTERPETLDFLRKHIAQLSRELSGLGLGDASYAFNGEGFDNGRGSAPDAGTVLQGANADMIVPPTGDATVRPLPSGAGLDLRF